MLEILKRLPGVSVGPSGGVTIRGGARVSYLVDGKPVRREIALAIPAGQIERVEVIPNPPAEYDSGSEALINLVLRRDADAGWSGTASAALDTHGGVRTGVDVAHGGRDWTFNFSGSFRSLPLETRTWRVTEFFPTQDDPAGLLQSLSITENTLTNRLSGQIKASRESGDDNSTSLLIGASFNRIPQDQRFVQSDRAGGRQIDRTFQRTLDFRGFYPYGNFSIARQLSTGLTMDASVQVNLGDGRDIRRTFGDLSQLVIEDVNFAFVEPNVTITRKFAASQVVFGATYSANPVRNRLKLSDTPADPDSAKQAYDFEFDRAIYAAFISYEGSAAGLAIKPAVRFERIVQNFADGAVEFAGLNSIDRVLPSLHLSKKIDEKNLLKASFTTRTDRPDALNLNPFAKVISPFFVERGNSFLKPSIRKQYDLTYAHERSRMSISQSIYYRDTQDDISRFYTSDDSGLTTSSFTNLGSSKTYGYSGTLKGRLSDRLQISVGADLFHKEIVAPITLSQLGRVDFESFNLNGTADYKIDDKSSVSAQLSFVGTTFDLGIETPRYFTSELQYKRDISNNLSLSVLLADYGIPLTRTGSFTGVNLAGTERIRAGTRLIRFGIATKF